MPVAPLSQVPGGSNLFIDANIFIYALNGQSAECRQLLERCSREEVTGISLFEVLHEATHRLMLAEALSQGLIRRESAAILRANFNLIGNLGDYWQDTQRILALNLLFLSSDEDITRKAQVERDQAHLLTNDSLIVACMRTYQIQFLATRDTDFERVPGIQVFRPSDLP